MRWSWGNNVINIIKHNSPNECGFQTLHMHVIPHLVCAFLSYMILFTIVFIRFVHDSFFKRVIHMTLSWFSYFCKWFFHNRFLAPCDFPSTWFISFHICFSQTIHLFHVWFFHAIFFLPAFFLSSPHDSHIVTWFFRSSFSSHAILWWFLHNFYMFLTRFFLCVFSTTQFFSQVILPRFFSFQVILSQFIFFTCITFTQFICYNIHSFFIYCRIL